MPENMFNPPLSVCTFPKFKYYTTSSYLYNDIFWLIRAFLHAEAYLRMAGDAPITGDLLYEHY